MDADDLSRAVEKDAALMDVLTREFADELHEVLTLTRAQIQRLLRELATDRTGRVVATTQNLQRAVALRQDILGLLERAGYHDLVARATDEPLDRMTAQVLKSAPKLLTAYDLDALVALKEIRYAELLQLGEEAGIQMWRVVVDGVLGIRDIGHLVDDVADMLDVSDKIARQVYDTAVSSFSRQVALLGATGDAHEEFVYVGPNDHRTRPFCAALIGDVREREDIDKMDNGQLPNVMLTGGGWNCRHQWRRITSLDRETLRGQGRGGLIDVDEGEQDAE